jgi:integrase
MARITKPLSDAEIKKAKPRTKEYSLVDGGGLLLRILPSGAKSWFFNYYHPHTKRRNKIGLGSYPTVSLAKARKERERCRELLVANIDPKQHRVQSILERRIEHGQTLDSVYKEWFAVWSSGKDQTTINKAQRQLELYALPRLGKLPVKSIGAPVVIDTLKPLEALGKIETLGRVRTRLNQIMSFAVNTGIVDYNPLVKISDAFKPASVISQPALRPENLPELMRAIDTANIKSSTRQLMLWSLHTLVRPKEAAGTRWAEINFEDRLWTIPAKRMKGGKREHVVPLTEHTINILEKMRPLNGHREHVFVNERDYGRPASSQSINRALVRMGFQGKQTAHGFRSIGSTALNEQGFAPDVIEAVLAHVDKNEVRRAYNRSTYLNHRRGVMQWWGDYISLASMDESRGLIV